MGSVITSAISATAGENATESVREVSLCSEKVTKPNGRVASHFSSDVTHKSESAEHAKGLKLVLPIVRQFGKQE